MSKPTTPTGRAIMAYGQQSEASMSPEGWKKWWLKRITVIEQEAADMAIAKAAMAGPVITDKATLDRGFVLIEAKIRQQLLEELRERADRLPAPVFLPHDIERIYAGETLPLVTRHALWGLLNPEDDR